MSEYYLQQLTGKLIDGLDRLPDGFRRRHLTWLKANQNPDGGFSGRAGGSDLYYTGFALRSLAVLQGLTPEIADASASFLRKQMQQSASVIDLFSFLVSSYLVQLAGGPDILNEGSSDWQSRVTTTLESCRTEDGGYAKTPGERSGSTYHTFLVALIFEMLERTLPQMNRLVDFVKNRRRDDGGFVEVAPMRRSGTNPTAAAIGILEIANTLDEESRLGVISFLSRLPSEFEGGFRANDRIVTADLLSTFTGTWTLFQLKAEDRLDFHSIRSYAQALEASTGGFRGGLWDNQIDVEYTFYGLGVLGLLANTGE